MALEAKKIEEIHDEILGSTLEKGSYTKLYSFKHVINAIAVRTTASQVLRLPKMNITRFTFLFWFISLVKFKDFIFFWIKSHIFKKLNPLYIASA